MFASRRARPLVAASLLMALGMAVSAQSSKDTSFGVFPFLVGNMDGQIASIVADARSQNLDAIYVSVFRATGPRRGQLWIDDTPRRWNLGIGAVRPNGNGINLQRLVTAAHASGLQVIGVLKCFDASVQPDDAAHRQMLLDVVDYLTESYDSSGRPVFDLDGLALDYIRYVSSGCTGKNATLVTDLVGAIKQRIQPLSLHAYLLAGRFTFDGPTYDLRFNSYTSVTGTNRRCYGQDWEALARHLDVMMPMAYTANGSIYSTVAQHRAYVQTVASYARLAAQRAGSPATRVVPTIRTYNTSGETCTAQTVEASILGALAGGGDGYQAFRYGTLRPNASWIAKMRQYASPGANRPVPDLSTAYLGMTARFDASRSKDGDDPVNALRARYDLDLDGAWDSGWVGVGSADVLLGTVAGPTEVGVAVRDPAGHVGYTRRRLAPEPALASDRPFLSAAAGGTVRLTIRGGPAAVGTGYVVLGTLSGTSPGTSYGGRTIPLNFDGLTTGLIQAIQTPLLVNFLGTIPPGGQATARFVAPPGLLSAIPFRVLHWGVVGIDNNRIRYVTNPVGMLIQP